MSLSPLTSVAPVSELWVFNEVPKEIKLTGSGLDIGGLLNIKLVHKEGNAIIR
jgi:ion channel POLLUX/CASTOR